MATKLNINSVQEGTITITQMDSAAAGSITDTQQSTNKVTSVSSSSTDETYNSAKVLYTETTNLTKINESQSLTDVQKLAIKTKIGAVDETVNITITCEDTSILSGRKIKIVMSDGDVEEYTYSGSTLVISICAYSEYTIKFPTIIGWSKPDDQSYKSFRGNVRNISVTYTATPYDLSLVDINGNALENRETANCYVVRSAGTYMLPLVYGCAIKDGAINSAAYTQIVGDYTQPFYNYLNNQITSPYIEIDTGVSAASGQVVLCDTSNYTFSNISIISGDICRYLQFDITSIPELGGNATIAIKDSAGQIMWSWHLWAYPFELTTKLHVNTTGYYYKILDVNLGWVKDSVSNKYGTCPHYQWGRKDPMLRPSSYNVGSESSSRTDVTGLFGVDSISSSVAQTIQNPNRFNKGISTGGSASNEYNWWQKNGSHVDYYNYWDYEETSARLVDKTTCKTIYDPSPVGFTVPCGNAYTGFSTSTGGTFDYGWTWDGRYFPTSGFHNWSSGDVYSVGSYGYCWITASYSYSQSRAMSLSFDSTNVGPQIGYSRAYGFALAPVSIS